MGANDDLLLKRTIEANMSPHLGAQQPQVDFNQLLQMLQNMSNATGASISGWADMIKTGVLTPEQVFNLLFRGRRPDAFEGKTAAPPPSLPIT